MEIMGSSSFIENTREIKINISSIKNVKKKDCKKNSIFQEKKNSMKKNKKTLACFQSLKFRSIFS